MFKINKLLILGIIVTISTAFLVTTYLYMKINILQTDVSNLQSTVTTLETENLSFTTQVANLQSEKTSLESNKTNLESQVSSLQSEVATLNSEKSSLESQVSSLQSQITSLESQINSLESQITSLENEVTQNYNTGYDVGYTQGVEDGAGRGWNIRDPTYAEALAFMTSDKTDENEYTDSYTCHDFTADFKNNAFQVGYRCGYVFIEFPQDAHAIICFDTTDNGLFYVDPQDDEIITLMIGQPFFDRELYEVDFDDTLIAYDIIW